MSISKQFKSLGMGVAIAFAITCIVFLGYSILITYTGMTERSLPIVVAVTTFISVLVAGFDAAKDAEQRGWLWGMCAGLVYILVLVALMMGILQQFAVGGRTFIVVALALAGGGVGGILGINMRNRK